jgi:hypothetical protein
MTDPITLALILHWLAQHLFAVITFMLTVLGGGAFALRKMPAASPAAASDDAPDDAANAAPDDAANAAASPAAAANAAAAAALAQVKANNQVGRADALGGQNQLKVSVYLSTTDDGNTRIRVEIGDRSDTLYSCQKDLVVSMPVSLFPLISRNYVFGGDESDMIAWSAVRNGASSCATIIGVGDGGEGPIFNGNPKAREFAPVKNHQWVPPLPVGGEYVYQFETDAFSCYGLQDIDKNASKCDTETLQELARQFGILYPSELVANMLAERFAKNMTLLARVAEQEGNPVESGGYKATSTIEQMLERIRASEEHPFWSVLADIDSPTTERGDDSLLNSQVNHRNRIYAQNPREELAARLLSAAAAAAAEARAAAAAVPAAAAAAASEFALDASVAAVVAAASVAANEATIAAQRNVERIVEAALSKKCLEKANAVFSNCLSGLPNS